MENGYVTEYKIINEIIRAGRAHYPDKSREELLQLGLEIVSENYQVCVEKHSLGQRWKLRNVSQ